MRPALLILLLAAQLGAADLGGAIRALLKTPSASRAAWGIQITDLKSGRTLFALNEDRLFIPASNTKLFSTALGLMRLGPDHRFRTRVLAGREPAPTGVLAGDLILAGGGDPNLSARAIPYRKEPPEGNPLEAIEELAAQLQRRGIRRVEGSVVGDDTFYPWEPYAEGWALDDALWEYGAPVSALTVNDNFFSLKLTAGASPGDPVMVSLNPPLEFYTLDNRVRTARDNEARLHLDREPGSRLLQLWGAVPAGESRTRLLAIHDPALYAAEALRDALIRRGVDVRGPSRARHLWLNEVENLEGAAVPPAEPAGVELARRESAPLIEDLRITNKVSQNLHAELVLRAVGRARRNAGTRRAGLLEMAGFLKEIGIAPESYELNDGSGLSRMNLVSPAAVVALLRFLHASQHGEAWMGLLPVGGEDGTLDTRFKGTAAAGNVRAKTGTLSHVSALSGYVRTRRGALLAFSILANNYDAPSSEIRAVIDKIVNRAIQ